MKREEESQIFIELYDCISRVIIEMETECLRHNTTLSKRERDVMREANEFRCVVWEMIIHDLNKKDPYKD